MLLFSGCVYRVPSSTEHVTRTSYTYTIPPVDQAYGIPRDDYSHVKNVREKKRYRDKEKHKPHHISDPDSNRYSMKTEQTRIQPMVHPQYRQKQETVNKKNLKPKVYTQHREKQHLENRIRPKVHPKYQHMQKVEHKKKIEPKVHLKHQETWKADNQMSSGPKVHPHLAENKKRSDHSKKKEETIANTNASKR
jgi:transposase